MVRHPHVKWPFIKVCGIQTACEGTVAFNSGANAIGFLIGLTHRAEDKIDIERAQHITRAVRRSRPDACTVLVSHLLDPEEIARLAEHIEATAIQVHGDMLPADVSHLRMMAPSKMIIKTIHIGDEGQDDAIRRAGEYARVADAFLTDSKSVDSDGAVRLGGTGKRHDPSAARALIKAFPARPVIIAGGLNPSNIGEVIRQIRPAGIDANSGLEHPDGSKDAEKIRVFSETAVRLSSFMRSRRNLPRKMLTTLSV